MPALHVREMPAASRDAALELPEVRIPKLAVIFRVNGSTARNGVSRGACTKLIGGSPAKPLHRTQQRARRYPARAKLRNASTMFRMAHPCSVGFQLGPIQVPRLSAPLAEVGKVADATTWFMVVCAMRRLSICSKRDPMTAFRGELEWIRCPPDI